MKSETLNAQNPAMYSEKTETSRIDAGAMHMLNKRLAVATYRRTNEIRSSLPDGMEFAE
jgi:hypothetical protein